MSERSASRSPRTEPAAAAPPGRGILRRKCACGNHTVGGEECEDCKQRQSSLQRAARGPAGAAEAPPIVHEVLSGQGEPLQPAARAFMEPRFRHDFSGVRVHRDARAAESAGAVGALAYTVGSHIVFGARQYRPASIAGRRLLAHELAHVVQQRGTALQRRLAVGPSDAPEERQAESCAEAVVAGQAPPALAAGGAQVQRAGDEAAAAEAVDQLGQEDAPGAAGDSDADVQDGEVPAGGGTVAIGELSDAQQGADPDSAPAADADLGAGTVPAAPPEGTAADQPIELEQGKGKAKGKGGGGGKPAKPAAPARVITNVDVSLSSQKLEITWSDGKTESAQVSTGRGCPNTKDDPCADTANWACTPKMDLTLGNNVKGGADYKNQEGDAMSWYVELNADRGIGIHDSQLVNGSPLSHGCIRTGASMAKTINQNVTSKTKVHVTGKAPTKAWTKEKMGSYKNHCPDPPAKSKPKKQASPKAPKKKP